MAQRDSLEFLAALAVGTAAGAAVARLLRPEPVTRSRRLLERLAPHRKRMRENARRARGGFGEGAAATVALGGALRDAGRAVLRELRGELRAGLARARNSSARAGGDRHDRARRASRGRAGRLIAS